MTAKKSDLGQKKSLTSKQICDIIKYCKDSGVISLEFRDLKVKFSDQGEHYTDDEAYIYDSKSEGSENQIHEDTILQDEIDIREDQLAMADVENPELYDELRELNELEGAVNAEREHNDSE